VESWRRVWRNGASPQLSTTSLEALEKALVDDDPRLLQGATSSPPLLHCVRSWSVEAACLIGFCGVVDMGGFLGAPKPATVDEVEQFFSKSCMACDQAIGEPAACRWLLNAYDNWTRQEMIQNLLPEVRMELDKRRKNGTRVG